ncbi:hypothetical protein MHYP_G00078550 [Metynnis hypsauchen]
MSTWAQRTQWAKQELPSPGPDQGHPHHPLAPWARATCILERNIGRQRKIETGWQWPWRRDKRPAWRVGWTHGAHTVLALRNLAVAESGEDMQPNRGAPRGRVLCKEKERKIGAGPIPESFMSHHIHTNTHTNACIPALMCSLFLSAVCGPPAGQREVQEEHGVPLCESREEERCGSLWYMHAATAGNSNTQSIPLSLC